MSESQQQSQERSAAEAAYSEALQEMKLHLERREEEDT